MKPCHTYSVREPTDSCSDRSPLPKARLAPRGVADHLRGMSGDVCEWSAQRASAASRVAGRAAPAVLTAVFIGSISVGLGMLVDGRSSSSHHMRWQNLQVDIELIEEQLEHYERSSLLFESRPNLPSYNPELWRQSALPSVDSWSQQATGKVRLPRTGSNYARALPTPSDFFIAPQPGSDNAVQAIGVKPLRGLDHLRVPAAPAPPPPLARTPHAGSPRGSDALGSRGIHFTGRLGARGAVSDYAAPFGLERNIHRGTASGVRASSDK